MNNKEKFLSKIGKLIEKGGISEDELATFFAPDEDEAPMEGKAEKAQPMDENAQAEVAEGAKGKEAEPTENAVFKPFFAVLGFDSICGLLGAC